MKAFSDTDINTNCFRISRYLIVMNVKKNYYIEETIFVKYQVRGKIILFLNIFFLFLRCFHAEYQMRIACK